MKFRLKYNRQQTVIPPELVEIYQPVLGYEAIAVWINIYHALINGHIVSEPDLLLQMNITQRTFRASINELKKYKLLETEGKELLNVIPPLQVSEFPAYINSGDFSPEQQRRFVTLVESFCLKRGQAVYQEDANIAATTSSDLSEQQADEFATRFIKECNFIPSKQLRDRFDLWFSEIRDSRLLEELLERTKRKVHLEGSKGSCPSNYADKIVRQWLVQGIRTHEDLLRHDQEFQARWEYYRVVEKELGRSFNSLTPAEKGVIDRWAENIGVSELGILIKKAILSGEYQGKGAPGVAFIDAWFKGGDGRKIKDSVKGKKTAFTHQHSISDLQKVIDRKTMVGLEAEDNER